MSLRKYEKVEVEWEDSTHSGGWSRPDENDWELGCSSVGYLVRESDDQLMLALSQAENGQLHNLLTIPKVAVRKVKRLK